MSDDDLQDELLSRALDGDLDAAEQARVQSDPELAAGLATLAQLRRRLADVIPLTPEAVDSLVARALAEAADESPEPAGTPATPPAPSTLAPRPRRAGWLAAAAAVVVLAGLGIAVATRDGDDADRVAEPADTTVPEVLAATADTGVPAGGAEDSTSAADSGGAADAATEPAPSALDQERVALTSTAALAELAASPTTLAPAEDPCADAVGTAIALARLGGRDVVVVRSADGREARALDATTCAVVAVVAIP